jgi:ABC-2 type transport system permease protein
MEWTRIRAELYKNALIMRHNYFRLFDVTLWPVTLFFAITLFLKFVSPTPEIIFMAISGLIGWRAVYHLQIETPLAYMDCYWVKNTSHQLASPINFRELITAGFIAGTVKFLVVLTLYLVLGYLLFDFWIPNFLVFSIATIQLAVTGLILSLLVFGIVILYTHKAITFALFIPDLLVLLSGVYYPISIFPTWLVKFVHILPTFYGFELMKSMVGLGTANYVGMIIVTVVWLVGCLLYLLYALKQAKKRGMLVKFN